MTLWIIFAGLTALALSVLLWPLRKRDSAVAGRSAYDASVYRDQLKEVESDFDRGLIGEREASAAKLEISRRLLAAADNEEELAAAGPPAPSSRWVVMAGLVCVPALSIALYLLFGSPQLPDQPHAARMQAPTDGDSIAVLIAKVEASLQADPRNGRGWDLLAPIYLKMRRYQDAANAYSRSIRLLGESVQRLSGYGEALVKANNGIVPETARKVFERALALDQTLLMPRFWLAMAKEQDGKFGQAAVEWRNMLRYGSENARWRKGIAQRLKVAESKAGKKDPATATDADDTKRDGDTTEAAPGLTQEQVAAASQMSVSERAAMINQMVDGLAERLKEDGSDLNGWFRLVRAYIVLGKESKAKSALADARRNFKDNEQALTKLTALAESLGL